MEESGNTMNVEQQQETQPTAQTETIQERNNDTVSQPLIKKVDERFIGRPVSGKPWKKLSKTAYSSVKKIGVMSRPWEKRKELASQQRELRAKIKALKEEANLKKQQRREAAVAKQKRKEENELKGSAFQVIKNTDKIRKWHKKARSQLRKLPSSMFEAVIKKEYNY